MIQDDCRLRVFGSNSRVKLAPCQYFPAIKHVFNGDDDDEWCHYIQLFFRQLGFVCGHVELKIISTAPTLEKNRKMTF